MTENKFSVANLICLMSSYVAQGIWQTVPHRNGHVKCTIIHYYLVSGTAFRDDNIARETANSHAVRIHQCTVVFSNTADSEQEITQSVKHLQSQADNTVCNTSRTTEHPFPIAGTSIIELVHVCLGTTIWLHINLLTLYFKIS